MKIALVYSGTDQGFQNFESVPPVGLISLYSKLSPEHRASTTFLDGNLVSTEFIETWLKKEKPEIVGISSLTFGYGNAIKIGEAAKAVGSLVILGGRHATDFRENILREMRKGNRPFDYLVSGEGEEIFNNVVEGYYSKAKIPIVSNLLSSDMQNPVIPEQRNGIDMRFPVLDYSLLKENTSPEEYMKHLGRIGILEKTKVSMPIISQRGCAYRTKTSHCKFCSIPLVNPKLPIEIFQKSLENLIVQTKADHVWITDGDLTGNRNHLMDVKDSVNKVREKTGKDFLLYCFARSDDLLRPNRIQDLHSMGVRAVFVGYEHGDDDVLRLMNKNTTVAQNIESTKILADVGIEVTCAGLVLGTPPETKETLERVVSFSEQLSNIGNVRSIFASPVYPFPGAMYWNDFLNALEQASPELADHISKSDSLDQELLVRSFHDTAHLMKDGSRKEDKPSFEEILEVKEYVSNLLGKGIQFTEKF